MLKQRWKCVGRATWVVDFPASSPAMPGPRLCSWSQGPMNIYIQLQRRKVFSEWCCLSVWVALRHCYDEGCVSAWIDTIDWRLWVLVLLVSLTLVVLVTSMWLLTWVKSVPMSKAPRDWALYSEHFGRLCQKQRLEERTEEHGVDKKTKEVPS